MSSLPVLVLNSGSSSIKFAMYEAGDDQRTKIFEGAVDGIGTDNGKFWIKDAGGQEDRRPDAAAAKPLCCIFACRRRTELRPVPCSEGDWASNCMRWPEDTRQSAHHAKTDRRDRKLRSARASAYADRRLHHARSASSSFPAFRISRCSIPISIAPCQRLLRACPSPMSTWIWECVAMAITAFRMSRSSINCSRTFLRS